MDIGGERQATAALPGTQCRRCWMVRWASVDGYKVEAISFTHRCSNPEPSV